MSEGNHRTGVDGDLRWLTVIGIGEDGFDAVPQPALERLKDAEVVYGGARHLAALQAWQRTQSTPLTAQTVPWPSPLTAALDTIATERGRPTCVLASGDPFWFGIGATLARWIPAEEMAVYPAASAYSLAAARMGWPLQTVRCLSVHGRDLARVRQDLAPGRRLLLLSWDGSTPADLAHLLCEDGYGASELTVLEHLGHLDAERIRTAPATEWAGSEAGTPVADLNTIALTCRGAPAIPSTASCAPGRSEDAFEHDGPITKSEVRAATLAYLAPRPGERLWDIGAGSGAVGIEWMRAADGGHALAVESDPERCARIRRNAERFGVPDLTLIEGRAPACLPATGTPDAVFVGGGLTEPGLLEALLDRLAPQGRIVANSVTAEGDARLQEAHQALGGRMVRLSVERAEPLGRMTGWRPLRAVTLWAWSRSDG